MIGIWGVLEMEVPQKNGWFITEIRFEMDDSLGVPLFQENLHRKVTDLYKNRPTNR